VSVAVERDRDRRVAHEGLEHLRVDTGRDHQRRERVAAFVEGHGLELTCSPGALGALGDGRRAVPSVRANTSARLSLSCVSRCWTRQSRSTAGIGVRGSRPPTSARPGLLLIPRALDADQAGREVEAVPGERLQLATPQAGVEGGGPERAISAGALLTSVRASTGVTILVRRGGRPGSRRPPSGWR
jgi:hypothetical protein